MPRSMPSQTRPDMMGKIQYDNILMLGRCVCMCLPLCLGMLSFCEGVSLCCQGFTTVLSQRRLFAEGTVGVLHPGSRRQLGVVMTRYDDCREKWTQDCITYQKSMCSLSQTLFVADLEGITRLWAEGVKNKKRTRRGGLTTFGRYYVVGCKSHTRKGARGRGP